MNRGNDHECKTVFARLSPGESNAVIAEVGATHYTTSPAA